MRKHVIGVDIGGTKIAAGIVGARRAVPLLKSKVVLPTLAEKGFKVSLGQVYKAIEQLLDDTQIEGIGICAPGPLDPATGIVHNPPNLLGWRDVPLAELIRKRFGKKTKVENDANAAGMAELIWGAAKGYKNVFYATVSTGIGTGIIIDGKIYHGKNGMAGEGGHLTLKYDDKNAVCKCGSIGCIERMASGTGVVRDLLRDMKKSTAVKKSISAITFGQPEKLTMFDIGRAAKAGNKFALKVVEKEGKLLGVWLGGIISLLDPEIIVIGGGVSLIGKPLFDHIRKNIPSRTINILASKTPIVQAGLKKDVGIFGAASIIM